MTSKFVKFRNAFEDFLSGLANYFQPLIDHVEADLKGDLLQDSKSAVAAALVALPNGEKAAVDAAIDAVKTAAVAQGIAELSYVSQNALALNAVAQAKVQQTPSTNN